MHPERSIGRGSRHSPHDHILQNYEKKTSAVRDTTATHTCREYSRRSPDAPSQVGVPVVCNHIVDCWDHTVRSRATFQAQQRLSHRSCAAAHARIDAHRHLHACSALSCNNGTSSRARAAWLRKLRASRPPAAPPSTTVRHVLRGPTSSGQVVSLRRLAATSATASLSAAPGTSTWRAPTRVAYVSQEHVDSDTMLVTGLALLLPAACFSTDAGCRALHCETPSSSRPLLEHKLHGGQPTISVTTRQPYSKHSRDHGRLQVHIPKHSVSLPHKFELEVLHRHIHMLILIRMLFFSSQTIERDHASRQVQAEEKKMQKRSTRLHTD